MIRCTSDMQSTSISHVVRLKIVLLLANESGCSITQIAVMQYRIGDVVATVTIHADLLDNFYILSSEADVVLNGEKSCYKVGDFIFESFGTLCEWHAVTDLRCSTWDASLKPNVANFILCSSSPTCMKSCGEPSD